MSPIDAALDSIDTVLLEWEALKETVGADQAMIEWGRDLLAYEKFKIVREKE